MKGYYLFLALILILSSCSETQGMMNSVTLVCKELPGTISANACTMCLNDPLKRPTTGGPLSNSGYCGYGQTEGEKGICVRPDLCTQSIGTSDVVGHCYNGDVCCLQTAVTYDVNDLCGETNFGQGAKLQECLNAGQCASIGGTVISGSGYNFKNCKPGTECCQRGFDGQPTPPQQPQPQPSTGGGVCTEPVTPGYRVECVPPGTYTGCGYEGVELCTDGNKQRYRAGIEGTLGCNPGYECWKMGAPA
jgi:hypothetical protein